MAMCEQNFKVWSSLNNLGNPINDSQDLVDIADRIQGFPSEEEWENNVDMDVDDLVPINDVSKTRESAQLIREKIRIVLEVTTELADKRASQCDQGDFLRLLHAFNQAGIHFA